MVWYSYAMVCYFYAMLWDIKNDMIWYAIVWYGMICYAMLWYLSKRSFFHRRVLLSDVQVFLYKNTLQIILPLNVVYFFITTYNYLIWLYLRILFWGFARFLEIIFKLKKLISFDLPLFTKRSIFILLSFRK